MNIYRDRYTYIDIYCLHQLYFCAHSTSKNVITHVVFTTRNTSPRLRHHTIANTFTISPPHATANLVVLPFYDSRKKSSPAQEETQKALCVSPVCVWMVGFGYVYLYFFSFFSQVVCVRASAWMVGFGYVFFLSCMCVSVCF